MIKIILSLLNRKNTNFLFILGIFFVLNTSCASSISTSHTEACVDDIVIYTFNPGILSGSFVEYEQSWDNSTWSVLSSTTPYNWTATNPGNTFYVRAKTVGGIFGVPYTNTVQTIIFAPPTAPTSISGINTICNGSSTTLTATGGADGSGATFQWFSGGCGSGAVIDTGISISVSPSLNTTYFVRRIGTTACTNATTCASQLVTVEEPPTAPTSISGVLTICNGSSTTLSASGGSNGSGATFQWYIGGCGTGAVIGTGATLNVSPSSNTTYFVRRVGNTSCTNTTTCASQLVTVDQSPTAPTSIGGVLTICNGSSTTLSAVGGSNGSGATFQWYVGGCGSGAVIGTGATVNVSPVSNTTYFVRRVGNTTCTNTTFCASQLVSVNTLSTSPTSASVDNAMVCNGGNITLTAIGGTLGIGATWEWYNDASFSTNVGSGSPLTITPISSKIYYVRAEGICNNTSAQNTSLVVVNGSSSVPLSTVALASSNSSSSCNVNDTDWHYYYNGSGELLAAINSNNQNLGNVTVTIEVGDLGPFGNPAGFCIDIGVGGEYAMPRSWDITVDNQPTTPVDVIFYYKNSDVASLTAQIAGLPNTADYISCWGDVQSESDLMMTVQHSSSSELFTSLTPTDGPNVVNGQRQISFQLSEFSGGVLHSGGGVSVGNALPVELLVFEAKSINNEFIQLNWETATEVNNDGFELLRSKDGLFFEKIAWVSGNGNSNQKQSYSFKDNDTDNGTYYYKLKQIDFNGEFEEFKIVSAIIKKSSTLEQITLRPNPTSSYITLDVQSNSEYNTTINVFDHSGSKVLKINKDLFEGKNSIKVEEVAQLSSGIYFINIDVNGTLISKKFIIRK